MLHQGENAIPCTGNARSPAAERRRPQPERPTPPDDYQQRRLAELVGRWCSDDEIERLTVLIARRHRHKLPLRETSAAAWFSAYARASLTRESAARYASEIERRHRAGEPIVRP
jgi:hypothetical protein